MAPAFTRVWIGGRARLRAAGGAERDREPAGAAGEAGLGLGFAVLRLCGVRTLTATAGPCSCGFLRTRLGVATAGAA